FTGPPPVVLSSVLTQWSASRIGFTAIRNEGSPVRAVSKGFTGWLPASASWAAGSSVPAHSSCGPSPCGRCAQLEVRSAKMLFFLEWHGTPTLKGWLLLWLGSRLPLPIDGALPPPPSSPCLPYSIFAIRT